MLYIPWESVFAERFTELHRRSINHLTGKHLGLNRDKRLESLVKSYLKVVLLREIFEKAEAHQDYNEICNYAYIRAVYLTHYDIDVRSMVDFRSTSDIETLGIAFSKAFRIDYWFSSPRVIDDCLQRMGGNAFVLNCAASLLADKGWQRASISSLINEVTWVEVNKMAAQYAHNARKRLVTSDKQKRFAFVLSFSDGSVRINKKGIEASLLLTDDLASQKFLQQTSLKEINELFSQACNEEIEAFYSQLKTEDYKTEDYDLLHEYIDEQLSRTPHERLAHLELKEEMRRIGDKHRKKPDNKCWLM